MSKIKLLTHIKGKNYPKSGREKISGKGGGMELFRKGGGIPKRGGITQKGGDRFHFPTVKIGHFWPKTVKKWPFLPKIQFFEGFWLITSIFVISFG